LSRHNQNKYNYKVDRTNAILSLNRALWGEVFPELRAAKIQWDNEKVSLFFYCDGEISESDRDSLECVGTEVFADFPDHEVEVNIFRCDYPERIPQNEAPNMAFVYFRKEKSTS